MIKTKIKKTYKQKTLYLLLVVSVMTICIPMHVQAQKSKAVLTFKDGTVKTGLGKLSNNGKIKFRTNKGEKAVKYDFSLLDQVKISGKTYVYVNVIGIENPRVLERVLVGKVYLYQTQSQGYMPYGGAPGGGFGGTGGVGFSGGYSYNINNFYVRRTEEDRATHLGSNQLFSKNFKEAASNYFKDCPELVQKIQNKIFKKRDLRDIVQFYNTECE